ncbi:MAG: DUF190 domain-containing protein [Clostridium sp.]|nr:DUF190 domain-containing protein [Clostridium sp.]
MSISGKCKMLRIYISEDQKYKGHNSIKLIVSKFKELEMEGVTITRAISGYGKDKLFHTVKIMDLSTSLPIIIEVVDSEEKVKNAAREVKDIVGKGLIVSLDVEVL